MAAGHFLERGYERFAFCGYENAHWSEQRCEAFLDYLRSRGYSHFEKFSTPWPEFGVLAVHDELQRLSDWIQELSKPFGILTKPPLPVGAVVAIAVLIVVRVK